MRTSDNKLSRYLAFVNDAIVRVVVVVIAAAMVYNIFTSGDKLGKECRVALEAIYGSKARMADTNNSTPLLSPVA